VIKTGRLDVRGGSGRKTLRRQGFSCFPKPVARYAAMTLGPRELQTVGIGLVLGTPVSAIRFGVPVSAPPGAARFSLANVTALDFRLRDSAVSKT